MNFTRKEIRSALFSVVFLCYCAWAVHVGTPAAEQMNSAWTRVVERGQN